MSAQISTNETDFAPLSVGVCSHPAAPPPPPTPSVAPTSPQAFFYCSLLQRDKSARVSLLSSATTPEMMEPWLAYYAAAAAGEGPDPGRGLDTASSSHPGHAPARAADCARSREFGEFVFPQLKVVVVLFSCSFCLFIVE